MAIKGMTTICEPDGDLLLRPFTHGDTDALVYLANNTNVSKYLRERFPYPYTRESANYWIAKTSLESEHLNFAIEWRGDFAGGIGLVPFDDVHRQTAEIGYWLGEPYWGRGLATRALSLFMGHVFSKSPFIRVQAAIFAENINSARVLKKNGFQFEGLLRQHITKHGRVHDALLYAKLRNQLFSSCNQ